MQFPLKAQLKKIMSFSHINVGAVSIPVTLLMLSLIMNLLTVAMYSDFYHIFFNRHVHQLSAHYTHYTLSPYTLLVIR
jgi:hypothetical protein